MSRKTESKCVDCQLPCLKQGCPYYQVEVAYCDNCNSEADYEVDGEDLCKDCTESLLNECFNDLSIEERAKLVDVDIRKIYE